jgi:CspA family cold shock protein
MKGTVKWYDETKNFGFILTEEGKDLFVHRSGLANPSQVLEENQTVEYEIGEGKKGPIAVNVKPID